MRRYVCACVYKKRRYIYVKLHLKIDLVSYLARAEGLVNINNYLTFSFSTRGEIETQFLLCRLFLHRPSVNPKLDCPAQSQNLNWLLNKHSVKCNQPRAGFELVSPCPFPTTITISWHINLRGLFNEKGILIEE